jgi:hypothetical protein
MPANGNGSPAGQSSSVLSTTAGCCMLCAQTKNPTCPCREAPSGPSGSATLAGLAMTRARQVVSLRELKPCV